MVAGTCPGALGRAERFRLSPLRGSAHDDALTRERGAGSERRGRWPVRGTDGLLFRGRCGIFAAACETFVETLRKTPANTDNTLKVPEPT
jgi:hypothetical protein